MTYLLDANVFIQAKNLHYGFDFCPAFWDWIDDQTIAGSVHSIERIADELLGGADELADWARDRPSLFLKPDAEIVPSLGVVSEWANTANYEPAAIATFLQVADYYLVAHAHAHDFVLVTHEIASASTRKIKIPDACIALDIKAMTPYEMLRLERARFVLGSRP